MRKIQLLLAFILLLVFGQTANSQVVISQVYGGGGNTGATYTHDFIELFNRGTSPVSLSGWSLQYTSATGTGNFGANSSLITELPAVVLQPGQYFLVQEAGGTVGSPLLTPDFIDLTPINLSGTAGKVALVSTATSLGCNGSSTTCSAAALANIIDLVGYGTANFFETAVAPAPSNTTSILRAANGCTDNNNNSTDFATGAPNPRNTSTALNPCSGPPVLTVSVAAGINASEPSTNGTYTVTLSAAAPAGGVTVTYTLSGTASQSIDYSDALSGTITIPQGSISGTITLAPIDDLVFEGTESIVITLNTASNSYTIPVGSRTANISLLDNDSPPSVSVAAGNTATEPATNGTFNINISTPAPAGGLTVTYTLSGTATLNTDYNDALGGSILIPAGSSSGTITLSVMDDALIEGTETIGITLNTVNSVFIIGATNNATINLNDNDNPPIVVNEVYGGGGNNLSNFKNDFIELFNNSNVPVNLTGWSVQYTSPGGTGNWQVTPLTGTIPARGYYLVQQSSGGSSGVANLPTPDATGTISMGAGSGKVALVNNTTALTGQNPLNSSIVDKVAYGTVTGGGFEGTGPAPTPSAVNSIQRTPVGFDANNNSTDFTLQLPTPKNSVTDITAPLATAFSPANGATNVTTAFTAAITFNENVEKGAGTITFRKTADGSVIKTFDVSSVDVTVAGNKASFIIQGLAFTTSYYFEVSNGALKDLSGNNFVGFSGNGTWNFTTGSQPLGIVGNVYNFNTCTSGLSDGFSFFSSVGAQVWVCTAFGRNAADLPLGSAPNGVQMNGFSGTNIPNVDWLISPSFDLTGTNFPLLSFWSRVRFYGQPLLLKVSTDYVSGDPSTATWTDLNGKFPGPTTDIWTLSENINLSAYKQSNVHIAFVYYSDEDEGARWTLDDISIINSATAPPPSLTVGTNDMQFAYAAAGTTAVKTFTFTGNDIVSDVTLNATGVFTLSKDGITFSSSLLYTVAEANNLTKTVFVRFAPTQNNQSFVGNIAVATGSLNASINLTGTSIDPVTTLEVVNWNIEWFGSTSNGPTNDNQQEQNIKNILLNIGADVYAVSEIVSEQRLASVVSQMPGYAYVISNYGSHTNLIANPPSALAEAQKMAFIYKTSVLSNVTTTALLSQGINSAADLTNPAYNYWASGRFPYMLTADATLNCITKKVRFVLVHAKANTNPTNISYERRKKGADTLHYTLQNLYPNDNVIILGDFNDDLDKSITEGFTTTSWSSFTTDAENFDPITLPLSLAGKKSTVSYNDVIDHVVISNDMQPYYMPLTASILTDVTSLVSNYGSTTSDHYPVFTRYIFRNTTAPAVTTCTEQVTFCSTTSNSYTIPAFVATDDCGDAVTYTYTVTGATERNGTGNNASGVFNVGTSTVTWIVSDNWGNTATCVTTVVINESPIVSIPDAYALPSGVLPNTVYIGYSPASSITLSSTVTGGTPTYSYVWSSGSTVSTTTVSPLVQTTYTVTVTDANTCQGTANKTVDVIDIRAGKKLDKVVICHGSNSLTIDGNAVAAHLAHGDQLGSCVINRTVPSRSSTANENISSANRLSVRVLSNPAVTDFTLMITATSLTEKMTMRVVDVHGRVMEQRVFSGANQTVKLGGQYHPGLYFVEILQGNEQQVLKLIKL